MGGRYRQPAGAGGCGHGAAQWVFAGRFGAVRQRQQLRLVLTGEADDVGDPRRAVGEGVGLVQGDCVDAGQLLERTLSTHHNPDEAIEALHTAFAENTRTLQQLASAAPRSPQGSPPG